MKRLAIVLLVLVAACGALAAETQGLSVGGGGIALMPVFALEATGIGGGITVGVPTIPLYFELSASTLGDIGTVSFGAEYRVVDRHGEGALGWYLGVGGAVLVFIYPENTALIAGARVPVGVEFRPSAKTGFELFLELGLEWLPVGYNGEDLVFTPMYILARPWLGVRYRF
jgi:hypothetical protein